MNNYTVDMEIGKFIVCSLHDIYAENEEQAIQRAIEHANKYYVEKPKRGKPIVLPKVEIYSIQLVAKDIVI